MLFRSGLDTEVQLFLNSYDVVGEMRKSVSDFLNQWMDRFIEANRSYMTIAIGCTGGQHRSVYLSEQLATEFRMKYSNVQVRHRELARAEKEPSH